MSKPTATKQAMLTAAGFETEDELYDTLAIEGKEGNDAALRALSYMASAFGDLETAERQLADALASFGDQVTREQSRLANGQAVSADWIAQSTRVAADASAKLQAACARISMLATIRNA